MLIRRVRVADGSGRETRVDVRLAGDRIAAVAAQLTALAQEPVLDGRDGALLPGLHDHHLHLFALAAARASLACGPPGIRSAGELASALRAAARERRSADRADDWIRGVGHHESAGGELDAARLDAFLDDVPIRIQHRSGALWIVNSRGLERLGLAGHVPEDAPAGVERRPDGRASGRLFRCDAWLRERLGASAPPDLADVGRTLARFGVCGVTDATPHNGAAELRAISAAVASGALPQRVHVMGSDALPAPEGLGPDSVTRGARKLVLHEGALPDVDALAACIANSHRSARAVAIHCVTRSELVVALAAFEATGVQDGDRIEHASVAPPELALRVAELGLCVVTQPGFVRERGDAYLEDVEARDRPWLYRCQGLLAAGVLLAAGTDAPFGDPDPWRAMQAAVHRRTADGYPLGPAEALSPERSLALFTTPFAAPGAAPRRVAVGEPADLCLLDRAWARARDRLASEDVAGVVIAGRLAWQRDAAT